MSVFAGPACGPALSRRHAAQVANDQGRLPSPAARRRLGPQGIVRARAGTFEKHPTRDSRRAVRCRLRPPHGSQAQPHVVPRRSTARLPHTNHGTTHPTTSVSREFSPSCRFAGDRRTPGLSLGTSCQDLLVNTPRAMLTVHEAPRLLRERNSGVGPALAPAQKPSWKNTGCSRARWSSESPPTTAVIASSSRFKRCGPMTVKQAFSNSPSPGQAGHCLRPRRVRKCRPGHSRSLRGLAADELFQHRRINDYQLRAPLRE